MWGGGDYITNAIPLGWGTPKTHWRVKFTMPIADARVPNSNQASTNHQANFTMIKNYHCGTCITLCYVCVYTKITCVIWCMGQYNIRFLFCWWFRLVTQIRIIHCCIDLVIHTVYQKAPWNGVFHGPLARYVKLRDGHAPGMPGTFSPAPRVSDPDIHHSTWCRDAHGMAN